MTGYLRFIMPILMLGTLCGLDSNQGRKHEIIVCPSSYLSHEPSYLIDIEEMNIVAVARNENLPTRDWEKPDFDEYSPECFFTIADPQRDLIYGHDTTLHSIMKWDISSRKAQKLLLGKSKRYCIRGIAVNADTGDLYAIVSDIELIPGGARMLSAELVTYSYKESKVIDRLGINKPITAVHGITSKGEMYLTQSPQTFDYYNKTKPEDWTREDRQSRIVYLNPKTGETRSAKPPDFDALYKERKEKPFQLKWWVQNNVEYFLVGLTGDEKESEVILSMITRKVGDEGNSNLHFLKGLSFSRKELSLWERGVPAVSGDGTKLFWNPYSFGSQEKDDKLFKIDLKLDTVEILEMETATDPTTFDKTSHGELLSSHNGDKIVYYGHYEGRTKRMPEEERQDVYKWARTDIIIADGKTGKTLKQLWVPLEPQKWGDWEETKKQMREELEEMAKEKEGKEKKQ